MDPRDEKTSSHLNKSEEEEEHEHPPVAAGLPSYQEATRGQAQPPPAYLAPSSGTTGPDSTTTTWTDEKRAARAFDNASSSPLPAQSENPLTFSIAFQSSWLLQKKIHIKPVNAGGADANAGVRWEVDYTSKYQATMNRLGAGADATSSAPAPRNVATFKYPEFILPSACGVTITFLPHENENPRHASPTIRFMHTTGMVTTKYALDLPVMRNGRYVWQTSYRGGDGKGQAPQGDEKARLLQQQQQQQQQFYMSEKGMNNAGNPTTTPHQPPTPSSSSAAAAAEQPFDFSNLFSDTWTPYTTQYLVDEREQTHVLARYTRAAPWAAERGKLEIFLDNRREDGLQPLDTGRAALVEGIVISCAAMVGMQDRLGLASSLVEAYADSYVGKGKGRA
ncbi:hypothetical protein PG990_014333 [Apiospora arundinis]